MCGIAGFFSYRASSPEVPPVDLGRQMVNSLTHRGPDDGGLLVAPGLLLGHRRLSVLDLSVEGHQPMPDGDETCWIVYNGEIYNFQELRLELEAAGHSFRSRTDTEVIVAGYRQWGRNVVSRLNGMFAFALLDRREDSLWLVRDNVGIKPLFYRDDGSSLWFGSEIKAILADTSVLRRPDLQGLDTFLTFGYVAAPATGFEGIRQLLPGESLVANRQGVSRQRWGQLPYPSSPTNWTADECADRLETSVDAAVRRQMVSDVPLGALLSGGLDSSAVVRSMRRADAKSIDTFTMGFDEGSFDESPYAARVAECYGTRHHSGRAASDVSQLLPTLVSHAEEPLADNSMIPFFLLARQVRREVTVALSGDGADELLAGYSTYSASQWAPRYRLIPGVVRRHLIERAVDWLPVSTKKYGATSLLRRFVTGAAEPALRDHCSWRRFVSPLLRERLYTKPFLQLADGDPVGQYAGTVAEAPDWLSPLQQQLHVDLAFHLPNDMLVKVDRMSMAHGLEVRVPMLDQEVIETCLAMPPQHKRSGGRGKLPLRSIMIRDLPPDLVNRRKAGFLAPLELWLRGPWQPLLRELLTEEFTEKTGMLQWSVVHEMLRDQASGKGDYAYPLFALLVLAIWWKTWITEEGSPNILTPKYSPVVVRELGSREMSQ